MRGMHGLTETDAIANRLLKTLLKQHDYFEVKHTLGLFTHETRQIWFTLTLDNFSVTHIGKGYTECLMSVRGKYNNMGEYWKGKLYRRI